MLGKFEEYVENNNIDVSKNKKVTQIKKNEDHLTLTYEDIEGNSQSIKTKNIFFIVPPLLEFIDIFEINTPQDS